MKKVDKYPRTLKEAFGEHTKIEIVDPDEDSNAVYDVLWWICMILVILVSMVIIWWTK
jgi:hypothetical protein